jgi:hypothetical protein
MDKIYSTLDKYWAIGIAVTLGCASVLLSRDAILQQMKRGPLYAITVIAVLVATLFMFLIYMHASRDELDLAKSYKYVEHIRPPQAAEIIVIFAVALLFGGLIAFVTNLLIYASIMLCFRIADLVALHMVRRGVRHAKEMKQVSSAPLFVMANYYLSKPHVILHVTRLLGCVVALLLAVEANKKHSSMLDESGWAAIISVSLLSEFVLYRWRQERKEKLVPKRRARASAA